MTTLPTLPPEKALKSSHYPQDCILSLNAWFDDLEDSFADFPPFSQPALPSNAGSPQIPLSSKTKKTTKKTTSSTLTN